MINEKLWPERFPLVLHDLLSQTAYPGGSLSQTSESRPLEITNVSFLWLQEVPHSQLTDILTGLNEHDPQKYFGNSTKTLASGPLWSHVGAGRDDGLQEGEYCLTIYPVQLSNLLHSETV